LKRETRLLLALYSIVARRGGRSPTEHAPLPTDRDDPRPPEVTSVVHPTRNDPRWKWQVERRLLHVCPDLTSAPVLADIDEERAKGLRVFKSLPSSHGEHARTLIAAADAPWGGG
jgi:hypothetical protein